MAEVTDYEQVARAEIEEVNRDAGNNPVKVGILTPLTGPGDPVAGFLVAILAADTVFGLETADTL
jgi:mannose/fructose/N-acetylgalactosamine-specific phosphotransferase system component IID